MIITFFHYKGQFIRGESQQLTQFDWQRKKTIQKVWKQMLKCKRFEGPKPKTFFGSDCTFSHSANHKASMIQSITKHYFLPFVWACLGDV